MHEKIRNYAVVGTVGLLTAVLSLCSWLGKDAAFSESERRALAQKPELSAESVFSGSFMTDFEVYTADQFPQRETFRTMHSLLRLGVFRQSDTDGLYMQDGYLAQMQDPLAEAMLDHADTASGYCIWARYPSCMYSPDAVSACRSHARSCGRKIPLAL